MYFRMMLIGFFEGIESERGIAWRVTDSLCLREFLQLCGGAGVTPIRLPIVTCVQIQHDLWWLF
jgi:Transposase domain (DUF772)